MRRWHNANIDILTIALIGFGLVLAAVALFDGGSWSPALVVLGLVVALAGLTAGVHAHGLVTALDGPTASFIEHRAQRHPRLRSAAAAVAEIGNPAAVALAAVISGSILSALYRSMVPGVVVVATTGAAVFAKEVMAAFIERPVTATEIAVAPGLSSVPHPFPSGHVAGTVALLGIVAVGIGARGSPVLRGVLAAGVGLGAMIVGFSRLVLQAHWWTDVVGGMLLAGIVVTVGAVVLDGTSRARVRAPRRRVAAARDVAQRRRLRA